MIATGHQTKKAACRNSGLTGGISLPRTVAAVHEEAYYFPLRNLSQILIVDIVGNKTADKADDKRSNDFDHDYHLLRRESLAGGVQRQSHYVNPHPTKSRVLPSF